MTDGGYDPRTWYRTWPTPSYRLKLLSSGYLIWESKSLQERNFFSSLRIPSSPCYSCRYGHAPKRLTRSCPRDNIYEERVSHLSEDKTPTWCSLCYSQKASQYYHMRSTTPYNGSEIQPERCFKHLFIILVIIYLIYFHLNSLINIII